MPSSAAVSGSARLSVPAVAAGTRVSPRAKSRYAPAVATSPSQAVRAAPAGEASVAAPEHEDRRRHDGADPQGAASTATTSPVPRWEAGGGGERQRRLVRSRVRAAAAAREAGCGHLVARVPTSDHTPPGTHPLTAAVDVRRSRHTR